MEDLAENQSHLSLLEMEGPGCRLTKDDSTLDYSIVAKFITKRALIVDVITRTFTPLWRARNGFQILFTFDNKADVDRILLSQLWNFDKHLVVMQHYDKDSSLQELHFDKASFWVQLHDIPLRYMTIESVEKISDVIGEVTQPTEAKDADGGNFLRVKVVVDLSLPLCHGRLILLENDKQIWVRFKYERPPNLCYWCGCLTHTDKDCKLWIESEGTFRPEQ